MSDTEREIAIRTQEKFEFYIISLVFTLLALSIQTAIFGISNVADIFELLGWLALLTSGISGVWRLEFISLERLKHAQKKEFEDNIFELKKLIEQGQTEVFVLEYNRTQPITERIENFEKAVNVLNPVIDKIVSNNFKKYTVHRYSFILGLTSLLLSRGYIPAKNLISQLCGIN